MFFLSSLASLSGSSGSMMISSFKSGYNMGGFNMDKVLKDLPLLNKDINITKIVVFSSPL